MSTHWSRRAPQFRRNGAQCLVHVPLRRRCRVQPGRPAGDIPKRGDAGGPTAVPQQRRCPARVWLASLAELANLAKINSQILQKLFKIANCWRFGSRLYQNELLQENMRLTAFFKLYEICVRLHRCNLKLFAKIGLKNQQFL